MRVLYSFPDEIGLSGIGLTALNQVREVAANGVEVTLYCTSLRGALPDDVRVVQTLSLAGRRIPHRVLGIQRSYRYHDHRVASALRSIGSEVDVVHCWPRATVQTCAAAHLDGIPCLREVPNTHTAHAFDVVAREFESLGMTLSVGHSHTYDRQALAREENEYAAADALLVPSEFSLRTFLDRGVPRDKLVLHRYGYDPRRFLPSPNGAIVPPSGRSRRSSWAGVSRARGSTTHSEPGTSRAPPSAAASTVVLLSRATARSGPAAGTRQCRGGRLCSRSVGADAEATFSSSRSIEEGSALVTYEARACGCVLLVSEAAGAVCENGVDGLVHVPGDVDALTRQLASVAAIRCCWSACARPVSPAPEISRGRQPVGTSFAYTRSRSRRLGAAVSATT